MTSHYIDKVKPELASFMDASGIPFEEFVDPSNGQYVYSIYDTIDLTEMLKQYPKHLCRADMTWVKYSIDYYYKPNERNYHAIGIRGAIAKSEEDLAEKEDSLFGAGNISWGQSLFSDSKAKFVNPIYQFASDRDTQIATQLLAAASWISNMILTPEATTRVRRMMTYCLVFSMWTYHSGDTWMKKIFPNEEIIGEVMFDIPNTNVDSQDPLHDYLSGIVNGDGIVKTSLTLEVNMPKKCEMTTTLIFDLNFEDETAYMDIYPMKSYIGNVLDICEHIQDMNR